METITIEITPFRAKLARSPIYWLVAASTGVFSGFAPLFLFYAGQDGASILSPHVIFLFIFIYSISLYYILFGIVVINKLRERSTNTNR